MRQGFPGRARVRSYGLLRLSGYAGATTNACTSWETTFVAACRHRHAYTALVTRITT